MMLLLLLLLLVQRAIRTHERQISRVERTPELSMLLSVLFMYVASRHHDSMDLVFRYGNE